MEMFSLQEKIKNMKLQLRLITILLLVIGIFSASHISIYSQTTQEEKKVELLGQEVQNNEYPNKLIGQVHNMINNNVEYVTIIITFYDETGEKIGSKSTYSKPSTIKSNTTAPFEMIIGDEISKNLASYDVTITWRYPGQSEKYSNVYGLNQ
jgi:hypothetical protein